MADAACELRSEEPAVTLLPGAGARLPSIEAFGVNVLRTPATPDHHRAAPFFWGGCHLAPWCDRPDTARAIPAGTRTVSRWTPGTDR
jgi:hypothetical protein